MLQKTTQIYANHDIPLKCDIYTTSEMTDNTPVVLFFHLGGLVCRGRDILPPWLAQVCMQRKWPLISTSYRLFPQTEASGLLSDVTAAYDFARGYEAPPSVKRHVIVAGASGGFFAASLIAQHLDIPPLAYLSIYGINTFRHPFYTSSNRVNPDIPTHEQVAPLLEDQPAVDDDTPDGEPTQFHPDMLLADGSKNCGFSQQPSKATTAVDETNATYTRGSLYSYFTYNNAWEGLVGSVDRGYGNVRADWPPTVVFHGNADKAVPLDLSLRMRSAIGADKVHVFEAEGQPHLFEMTYFLEDEKPGVGAIRAAVAKLDEVVTLALQ